MYIVHVQLGTFRGGCVTTWCAAIECNAPGCGNCWVRCDYEGARLRRGASTDSTIGAYAVRDFKLCADTLGCGYLCTGYTDCNFFIPEKNDCEEKIHNYFWVKICKFCWQIFYLLPHFLLTILKNFIFIFNDPVSVVVAPTYSRTLLQPHPVVGEPCRSCTTCRRTQFCSTATHVPWCIWIWIVLVPIFVYILYIQRQGLSQNNNIVWNFVLNWVNATSTKVQ